MPDAPTIARCHLLAEFRGGGRIDIGHWRKDNEHDSEFVGRSAECLDGIAVPQLVQGFEDGIAQGDQQQIVGGEDSLRRVVAEFLPVLGGQNNRGQDDKQP